PGHVEDEDAGPVVVVRDIPGRRRPQAAVVVVEHHVLLDLRGRFAHALNHIVGDDVVVPAAVDRVFVHIAARAGAVDRRAVLLVLVDHVVHYLGAAGQTLARAPDLHRPP